jgi:hypothetical protein
MYAIESTDDGKRYYCSVDVNYGIDGGEEQLSIVLTNGTTAWKSSLSGGDAKPSARQETNEHYLRKLEKAFMGAASKDSSSNNGISNYEFSCQIKDENALKFVIKESLNNSTGKIIFFTKLIYPVEGAMLDLLSTTSTKVNAQQRRIHELEDETASLVKSCESTTQQLEALTCSKDSLQDELLAKFCLVLNAKKREIVQLQIDQEYSTHRQQQSIAPHNGEENPGDGGDGSGAESRCESDSEVAMQIAEKEGAPIDKRGRSGGCDTATSNATGPSTSSSSSARRERRDGKKAGGTSFLAQQATHEVTGDKILDFLTQPSQQASSSLSQAHDAEPPAKRAAVATESGSSEARSARPGRENGNGQSQVHSGRGGSAPPSRSSSIHSSRFYKMLADSSDESEGNLEDYIT